MHGVIWVTRTIIESENYCPCCITPTPNPTITSSSTAITTTMAVAVATPYIFSYQPVYNPETSVCSDPVCKR
ncbi:unnamed protein product [Brugia timori]|uniref:Bm8531 n=2 Tax=Brugia TaxID=6278 RepID=A0A1I9G002_BRUMA|nr:Bm8531 [Brugia malayi]VDO51746.1 unnamed protein product [Brugia timori]